MKDKILAAVLAFFLGSFGVHRFYLGQTGLGFVYLLFCWTFIPMIASFIDCVIFLLTSKESFDQKYNRKFYANIIVNTVAAVPPIPTISAKDRAAEIERLHNLKERGIISAKEFEQSKRKLL